MLAETDQTNLLRSIKLHRMKCQCCPRQGATLTPRFPLQVITKQTQYTHCISYI